MLVLGNEAPIASSRCEILPSREFYDYEDKYLLDMARTRFPRTCPPSALTKSAGSPWNAIAPWNAKAARVDFF